jgi:hypothetical protein
MKTFINIMWGMKCQVAATRYTSCFTDIIICWRLIHCFLMLPASCPTEWPLNHSPHTMPLFLSPHSVLRSTKCLSEKTYVQSWELVREIWKHIDDQCRARNLVSWRANPNTLQTRQTVFIVVCKVSFHFPCYASSSAFPFYSPTSIYVSLLLPSS